MTALILAAAILHISPATVIPPTPTTPSTTSDQDVTSSSNSTSSSLPVVDDQQVQYDPNHPSGSDGLIQINITVTQPLNTTESSTSTGTSTMSTSTSGTGPFDECTEPDADELERRLRRANQHHKFPEVALLTKEKNTHTDMTEDARFFPTPESLTGIRYTNSTCPHELLGVTGNINTRSICPWTIIEDYNPTRYPPTIMVAQCRCPRCIDPSIAETGFLEDGECSCKPVTFKMKVLHRRECMMGIYIYESVYEEIPVACSCVRTITV
ncbi:uncharacterized protein [Amphiura filiformis]|uniref:uncharacterized protein isoform X2 n=1 Tax=Amphiura filiformis TaxID=82378 RepID=UPI003B222674